MVASLVPVLAVTEKLPRNGTLIIDGSNMNGEHACVVGWDGLSLSGNLTFRSLSRK